MRQNRVGHSQNGRPHHGAPYAHHRAAGEQKSDVRRKAANDGGDSENDATEKEDSAATKHISESAAGDDQNSEDQSVPVDDPLHGGDVGAEVLFHCRQGHTECSEVVSDDEDGQPHGNKAGNGRATERIFGSSHSTLPPVLQRSNLAEQGVAGSRDRPTDEVATAQLG